MYKGGSGGGTYGVNSPQKNFSASKQHRDAKIVISSPAEKKPLANKLHQESSSAIVAGRASNQFSASQQNKQESDWKRQLIEHDIRLQNAKLQMIELQHENKLAEMRELLHDLQDKNQQIELEKH